MDSDSAFDDHEMPNWLLLQILLRLPVKSIFRFKSVSKHWHSLITDPSFAYSYTNLTIEKKNYSNPWTLLFCYMNTCSGKTPPYSTGLYAAFDLCNSCDSMKSSLGFSSPQLELIKQIPNLDCLKLLACHNGLLLCCASQQQQELYFVCNPLTLRWLAIPRRPQLHKWVSIGFMVQPEDGSFLLVRIAKFSGLSNVLELESFCSNEGKWFVNKLVCDSPVCLFFTHRQAVPFRGILHWREYNNRIISYDPVGKTGKCRLIDMPKGRDRDGQGVLQVSRSRMCYFEICVRCISSGFYVWVLENYELGEWILHYRISLDQIQTSNSLLRRSVLSNRASLHPLTFHPLNPEVVYLMCGDRLALFDFKDGRLKIESEDRFSQSSLDSWTVVPFVLPPWPTPIPKPSWSSQSC